MTELIPIGKLIVQKACIEVAAELLRDVAEENETVASMLLELQMAANLAEAFNKTWSSIFWKRANTKSKKRVTKTLKQIAEKVIDHTEEAIRFFDELCDEQERNPTLELTNRWILLQAKLAGIREDLKFHRDFVEKDRIENLPLFKGRRVENASACNDEIKKT